MLVQVIHHNRTRHAWHRNAVNSGIVGTPELEDVQSRAEEEARQGLPEVLPVMTKRLQEVPLIGLTACAV